MGATQHTLSPLPHRLNEGRETQAPIVHAPDTETEPLSLQALRMESTEPNRVNWATRTLLAAPSSEATLNVEPR